MTGREDASGDAPLDPDELARGLEDPPIHVRWVVYSALITEDERTEARKIQARLAAQLRALDPGSALIPASGSVTQGQP